MDMDFALRVDDPTKLMKDSSAIDKTLYQNWERLNRLSPMYIKMTIAKNIRRSIPLSTKARDYLAFMKQCFVSCDQFFTKTLMAEFTIIKYDGSSGVQEHILQMVDIEAQLEALDMKGNEPFLLQIILNSLPHQFGPFKTHYNSNKINGILMNCEVCVCKRKWSFDKREEKLSILDQRTIK